MLPRQRIHHVVHRDLAGDVGLYLRRPAQCRAGHPAGAGRGVAGAGPELSADHAQGHPAAGLPHRDSAAAEPDPAAVEEHQPGDGDRRDGTDRCGARGRDQHVPLLRGLGRGAGHLSGAVGHQHGGRGALATTLPTRTDRWAAWSPPWAWPRSAWPWRFPAACCWRWAASAPTASSTGRPRQWSTWCAACRV
ncbi:hypothetical protein G6F59_014364 [Rhizopus arrhizus]|nr:hypothetical protein G6F59_014364 [Rhizopus arrhizus]